MMRSTRRDRYVHYGKRRKTTGRGDGLGARVLKDGLDRKHATPFVDTYGSGTGRHYEAGSMVVTKSKVVRT